MPRNPNLAHQVKLRLGRAMRLSRELQECLRAIQDDAGRCFRSTKRLPREERNARVMELMNLEPNIPDQLIRLANQLGRIRALLDRPTPETEAWLRKRLGDLADPPE